MVSRTSATNNRLGINKGWKSNNYEKNLRNYAKTQLLNLKLYMLLKGYFYLKSHRVLKAELRFALTKQVIIWLLKIKKKKRIKYRTYDEGRPEKGYEEKGKGRLVKESKWRQVNAIGYWNYKEIKNAVKIKGIIKKLRINKNSWNWLYKNWEMVTESKDYWTFRSYFDLNRLNKIERTESLRTRYGRVLKKKCYELVRLWNVTKNRYSKLESIEMTGERKYKWWKRLSEEWKKRIEKLKEIKRGIENITKVIEYEETKTNRGKAIKKKEEIGLEMWKKWKEKKSRLGKIYGIPELIGKIKKERKEEYNTREKIGRLKGFLKELLVKRKSKIKGKGLRYLYKKKKTKSLWNSEVASEGSYGWLRNERDRMDYNQKALKWWDTTPQWLAEQKKLFKEWEKKVWVPEALVKKLEENINKKRFGLTEDKWIKNIEENNLKLIKRVTKWRLKYLVEQWIMNKFRLNAIVKLVFPLKEKGVEWKKIYEEKRWKENEKEIRGVEYTLITANGTNVEVKLEEEGEGMLRYKEKLKKQKEELINKNKKSDIVQRLAPLLAVFINYLDPEPIVDQIAYELEKTKLHKPIKYKVKETLGGLIMRRGLKYTVGIIGKFNGTDRRRKIFIEKKNVCVQEFTKRVNYAQTQARARTGAFGVKMWISY